jgi:N-acetylornithine carbamoyltransferase
MQSDLRGRDLIGDLDFSKEEVETVLDVAWDLKRKRALGEPHALLRDKVLAMLFFFSSTRTRGSFEAGMAQLGGHAAFIESRTTQISHGDTEKEMGAIFGRYFDGIAIRHVDWGVGNRYLNLVAEASRVPILNMQCEIYHPHQCLADIMTIIEKKGRDLRGKKMVVSWAYASSYLKPISVPQSLILQMPRFGMDVVLAHPPEFKLMPDIMDQAREQARKFHTGFEVVEDMEAACQDADIVYAKSWGPLLTTQDPDEGKKIQDKYKSWITDEKKMALAKDDAIYMHPLPADREIEVSDAVLDGPQSVVIDEAENRLHAQKAVMALTMK